MNQRPGCQRIAEDEFVFTFQQALRFMIFGHKELRMIPFIHRQLPRNGKRERFPRFDLDWFRWFVDGATTNAPFAQLPVASSFVEARQSSKSIRVEAAQVNGLAR